MGLWLRRVSSHPYAQNGRVSRTVRDPHLDTAQADGGTMDESLAGTVALTAVATATAQLHNEVDAGVGEATAALQC